MEWVKRSSSRIWRGSYKMCDWRHLGKGAWAPRNKPSRKGRRSRRPNGQPRRPNGSKAGAPPRATRCRAGLPSPCCCSSPPARRLWQSPRRGAEPAPRRASLPRSNHPPLAGPPSRRLGPQQRSGHGGVHRRHGCHRGDGGRRHGQPAGRGAGGRGGDHVPQQQGPLRLGGRGQRAAGAAQAARAQRQAGRRAAGPAAAGQVAAAGGGGRRGARGVAALQPLGPVWRLPQERCEGCAGRQRLAPARAGTWLPRAASPAVQPAATCQGRSCCSCSCCQPCAQGAGPLRQPRRRAGDTHLGIRACARLLTHP
jgi:hypothetical protein